MSDIINDGGPAFPHDVEKHDGLLTTRFHGMSLRDWLAGMALQGMLAKGWDHGAREAAENAYCFADAIIKERQK